MDFTDGNGIECLLFQFCYGHEHASGGVPGDMQDIRFAADLAIFNVALSLATRRIDGSLIPFPASGTLEA